MQLSSHWILFLSCLFCLAACSSDKTYTLEELKNNPTNQLHLSYSKDADFEKINQSFEGKKEKEILDLLNQPNVSFASVSYGLYHLGNHYIYDETTVKKGVEYLQIAADQYLNPLAMSRLGRMYYTPSEQLPKGIQQDLILAYYYTNLAIALGNISEEQGEKGVFISSYMRKNSLGLFDALQSEVIQEKYDVDAAQAKLKKDLENIRKAYKEYYFPK